MVVAVEEQMVVPMGVTAVATITATIVVVVVAAAAAPMRTMPPAVVLRLKVIVAVLTVPCQSSPW